MKMKFGLVFDGDQRGADGMSTESTGWQSIFLPTSKDPDDLFMSLGSERNRLAARLHQAEEVVAGWLDALEGSDKHDWVNGLCDRVGDRTFVLNALAELWISDHKTERDAFLVELALATKASSAA